MKYDIRVVLTGVIEADSVSEAVNATNIDAGELTVHEIECEPQIEEGGDHGINR